MDKAIILKCLHVAFSYYCPIQFHHHFLSLQDKNEIVNGIIPDFPVRCFLTGKAAFSLDFHNTAP